MKFNPENQDFEIEKVFIQKNGQTINIDTLTDKEFNDFYNYIAFQKALRKVM